jgi:hypothetical protein
MNWMQEAQLDLRELEGRKLGLENMREHYKALCEDAAAVRGAALDHVPRRGGGTHHEERMLNNMVKRDLLKQRMQSTQRIIKLTERACGALAGHEQRVLELFYIRRQAGHIDRLCEELHVEQAQVYRIRNAALKKFTLAMYGAGEETGV